MDLTRLQGEDRLLVRRLEDLARLARDGWQSKFSPFLREREQLIGQELIRQGGLEQVGFYGGYGDAQRVIMGFFPPYEAPEPEAFPIAAVTASLPSGAFVSHRDALGALMSLGLKRESVGDLLVSPGRCDIFLLQTVADTVLRELRKIGGAGVRCARNTRGDFTREESFQEGRGTVSSLRLDCLVGLLTGLAREKSAGLIRSERVRQNHMETGNISARISQGDTVTIRGYGKYIVDSIGEPTRKGRLPVSYRKYV